MSHGHIRFSRNSTWKAILRLYYEYGGKNAKPVKLPKYVIAAIASNVSTFIIHLCNDDQSNMTSNGGTPCIETRTKSNIRWKQVTIRRGALLWASWSTQSNREFRQKSKKIGMSNWQYWKSISRIVTSLFLRSHSLRACGKGLLVQSKRCTTVSILKSWKGDLCIRHRIEHGQT